ncbi:alpha/beta hydrolase [Catellatospora sp. KI3]|uniref:alpha/beta fold hydrolase n=1 Tax=Catellatospora sp. KI3 TaxID=3041620 RepID=UPI0024822DE1|nr:alpha/beta hydrolase [Catellatospora sp. KI3]MDI1462394.1 alpha/beta hydrolase [Catellatospora sp. KI3]
MRIAYERRGSGSPLVLVHGIGHHWRAWEPVLDPLAAVHEVIAIDLPGFGRSPVPDGGMPDGMAPLVALIAKWLRREGLNRPHVAGNSLGGSIALELAAAGLAASATAFAPAGFWQPWQRRYALTVLHTLRAGTMLPPTLVRAHLSARPGRSLAFGMLMHRPGRLTAERATADALAMRDGAGFRAVARSAPGYQYRGEPTCPVTIAWGDRDRILLPRQATTARHRLPTATHLTLPRCGHVPMSDNPTLVTRTILSTTTAPPR